MKVATTPTDFNKIKAKLIPRAIPKGPKSITLIAKEKELALYCVLPFNRVTADELHKDGFGDWLRLTKDDIPPTFKPSNRYGYQAYVQGWLSYFEMHNSMFGTENRTLYFDWSKTNTDFELIIYLKPLMYGMYENGGGKYPFDRDLPPCPDSTFDPHQPKPPPPPTQS